MPAQVKLKKPGTLSPPAQRELEAVKETVDEVIKAIVQGEFDAFLDLIDKALYERIKMSQEEDGDPIDTRRETGEKIRILRSTPIDLVLGRLYRLRGEKYAGVTVEYLEAIGDADGDLPKAKVMVNIGNGKLKSDKVYIVPAVALEEIPEMKAAKPMEFKQTPKCKSCGEEIDYSGRGRPKSLCPNCEANR